MAYVCEGCGNTNAHLLQFAATREGMVKSCDGCGARSTGVPDVYFKEPYVDHNLSSEQFPGPKTISSRAEKKFWLNKCNLREAGDRVHGASSFDPISNRHAMESLRRKTNEGR